MLRGGVAEAIIKWFVLEIFVRPTRNFGTLLRMTVSC